MKDEKIYYKIQYNSYRVTCASVTDTGFCSDMIHAGERERNSSPSRKPRDTKFTQTPTSGNLLEEIVLIHLNGISSRHGLSL